MPTPWKQSPLNVLRGSMIGAVETVPGVSGGTIALVTGVYGRIIDSASHLISGLRLLISDGLKGRGLARAKAQLRAVDWAVVLPVLVGMVVGLLLAARLLEPVWEHYPQQAFGLFFGMILVSVVIPLRAMESLPRGRDYPLMAGAVVAAWLLTGLPSGDIPDPPLWFVSIVVAFAVAALALPGLSGAFVLMIVGIYAPTLSAVNERDFAYLGAALLGAIVGFGLFVKVLQWLLQHRRQATLAVMTGLMIGSLRALWPWQDGDRALLAPSGDAIGLVVALMVVGAAIVALIIFVEARFAGTDPKSLVAPAPEPAEPAWPEREPSEDEAPTRPRQPR
ncbi:DUF368 domain-containing protein [Tamaricihabitans halophyticus]|nr:DUF368 domain-containing protein [Tamaricihabitans halophyticus]